MQPHGVSGCVADSSTGYYGATGVEIVENVDQISSGGEYPDASDVYFHGAEHEWGRRRHIGMLYIPLQGGR